MVAAAVSTLSGVVGALAGSSLFGTIWRLFNKQKAAVMDTVRQRQSSGSRGNFVERNRV